MTECAECGRLAVALHSAQRHPDFDYCVTFDGNAAHKSVEGWESNVAHGDVTTPRSTARYWLRRREET